jgi:hypothetical protein
MVREMVRVNAYALTYDSYPVDLQVLWRFLCYTAHAKPFVTEIGLRHPTPLPPRSSFYLFLLANDPIKLTTPLTNMSNLKTFKEILQEAIDPDDTAWSYNVENLPRAQLSNAAGLIKFISVTSSDCKQQILLRLDCPPPNRAIHGELLDRLLIISFTDFRLRYPPSSPEGSPRLATGKENGDYITRMLVAGIEINRIRYHFFGHSSSQLKSRSCFMLAASKEEISSKIEKMGDLSKLKSVGKKAKRIGLLFSKAEMALTLSPDRCEDIDDITVNDYIFTDGCGLISLQLAKKLVQQRNIVYRGKRYIPSVYQIRYRGYKGVLTLDPTLGGQIEVQFRDSMRKFKDASNHGFSVVDYSKAGSLPFLYLRFLTYSRSLTLLDI